MSVSSRRLLLTVLVCMASSGGVLAISAWPASAFLGYGNRTGVFGGPGSGAGQFSLNPTTGAPGAGVAADDTTHDVYVVDTLNNRVQKFSSEGAFIEAWGWGVSNGEELFEVCTSGCQAGLPGAGEGQFSTPVSVAVDNSSGSSAGDVYIADGDNDRIEKFTSSGVFLGHFGAVGDPGEAGDPFGGLGGFKGGNSVYVDPASGNVWVADATNKRAVEFSSSGEYLAQIEGMSENAFGLTVDSSGDVYVVDGGFRVEEFGPGPSFTFIRSLDGVGETHHPRAIVTNAANEVFVGNGEPPEESNPRYQVLQFGSLGSEILPAQTFGLGPIGGSNGIAMDSTSGRIYVADGFDNDVDVFALVQLADVTTGESSNIKGTTASLAGAINPESVETHYFFEYGPTLSYGLTSSEEVTSGSTSQSATANLTELVPKTTYHYRLVATNANGTSRGQDEEFTTGTATAGVSTGPASNVGITTATLNGQLNPEGTETFYTFQYGTSTEYTAISEFEVSSSNEPISAVAVLSELEPGTTYHYQIRTVSEHGETLGEDRTFTTLPAVATVNDQSPFATGISLHEATLHGTINPGRGVTSYHFVYGPTAAYGSSAPAPEAYTQLNYEDDTVEQFVTGLLPETTYHYALVATNASGTITGPDETFSTLPGHPPTVETGDATGVSPTAATVTGIIDPAGQIASYVFEVGTSTSYGTQLFGAISTGEEVTAGLSGLLPGTTYHYRLVASDAAGVAYGVDRTFTTLAPSLVISQPGTPLLLPTFSFPPKEPVLRPSPSPRCKKGFVKKAGRCIRKHHKRPKRKRKR